MSKINYIIVHHTGGTKDNPLADTSHHTFKDVNAWHREDPKVWLGQLSKLGYSIGYHYFIDKKGKVTQGREDSEQAAHCQGYNNNPWDLPEKSSIGICLAGNFDVTMPTKEQIEALKTLLETKKKEYNIPIENIVPHRKFANKSCYGKHLSNDWLKTLLTEPKPLSQCLEEKAVIEAQKVEISKWKGFWKGLLEFIKANQ